MKKTFLIALFLLLPVSVLSKDAEPVLGDAKNYRYEHVIWDRIPISIDLPVSEERIIAFSEPVTIHNTDHRLTTEQVTILNNNGTLYITAKDEFGPVRVSATLKSGEVILLDLSAKKNADDRPIDVLVQSEAESNKESNQKKGGSSAINYISLVRYAIQSLYSPDRMIDRSKGITRFPMGTSKSVRLLKGTQTVDLPLVSWSKNGLYVTAVLVKNVSKNNQLISPSQFNGKWRAFSAYPVNQLAANGRRFDRTTVFLLSDQPFFKALESMRAF